MKTNAFFLEWVCAVLNPIWNVTEQRHESVSNLMEWNSDVFFGASILARPLPRLVEHLPVKRSDVFVRGYINCTSAICDRPIPRKQNVLPLPLVQFFLDCETRNEVCKFVRRDGGVAVAGCCDCRHSFPVRFRIRLVSSSIFSDTPPTAWSSNAMLCSTARTFSAALVLARSSASSRMLPVMGTMA